MTVTTIISIIYPDITSILGLVGGLVGIQQSYFLPLIVKLNLGNKRWYELENLVAIFFFGTLCIFGYISVAITII